MASRMSAFLRAAALLGLAAALASCATRPSAPGPRVEVEIGPVRTEALDQHRVKFTFEVRAANPEPRPLSDLSLACALQAGGVPVELAAGPEISGPGTDGSRSSGPGSFSLDPGDIRTRTFEGTADLGTLPGTAEAGAGPADSVPWRVSAALSAPGPAGVPRTLGSATAEGSFPLVREPLLTIRSIVLVRHELVNVLLELVLDVENPNPFPVDFSSTSYRFHGEGRKWASGTVDRSVTVPARGSAEVRLPILLNFTETGRDLFDLVAKLQVVRFRLEGQARVAAPVPFLPVFRMDFDQSGAVRVDRSLPAGH